MPDMEELAIKRDRGYLVRLVLMLAAGVVVSIFIWAGLTGDRVGGCMAEAFLGASPEPAGPEGAPVEPAR